MTDGAAKAYLTDSLMSEGGSLVLKTNSWWLSGFYDIYSALSAP